MASIYSSGIINRRVVLGGANTRFGLAKGGLDGGVQYSSWFSGADMASVGNGYVIGVGSAVERGRPTAEYPFAATLNR